MLSSTVLLVLEVATLFSATAAQSIAGKCTGQTCYIASLSGSTVEEYALKNGKKPKGGNATGDRCIKAALSKLGMKPPAGLRRFQRGSLGEDKDLDFEMPEKSFLDRMVSGGATIEDIEDIEDLEDSDDIEEEDKTLEKRQGCKANTLLFARGTTEIGAMGSTVGPAISTPLKAAGWTVTGINYDASLNGIYCIGLNGGIKCVDQLKALVSRCPNTNVVLSGYSQGAMVARECAAYSTPAVQKRIKGLALFGDPFNGASVKGVPQSNIKTWCNNGDGVCKGEFVIGAAHLSYTGNARAAATWIQGIAKS